MAAIDISTFLQSGQLYTFTLEPVGVLSYLEHPDLGSLIGSVQALPNIANATVQVGVPGQLGGTDFYSVTFTYVGDGSDVGAGAAQELIDAFTAATSVGWQFVGATTGTTGVQQQNQSTNPNLQLPSLPSGSSLWAILAIVVVIAFLAYGGGGLVKKFL